MIYEPHLLQPKVYNALLERSAKLSASSQALWGKMDVAQTLAHTATALEEAMTTRRVIRTFLGYIFGSVAKRQILTKGLPKNVPTSPSTKISDPREFRKEKERLLRRLEQFHKGAEAGVTRQPHDFFGLMTANEWARLQYIHVDHHLKQFGA